MAHWMLTAADKTIATATVQCVIQSELEDSKIEHLVEEFNKKLEDKLDDTNFQNEELNDVTCSDDPLSKNMAHENNAPRGVTLTDAQFGDLTGTPAMDADDMCATEEAVDKHIGAQWLLDVDGEPQRGKIVKRDTDSSENKICDTHKNPLLDSREFMVAFPYQSMENHKVNQIAEAIHSQVDEEDNVHCLLNEIVGYKKDRTALTKEDGHWISKNGNKTPKKTTRGLQLVFCGRTEPLIVHL